MAKPGSESRFDAAYYKRFYGDAQTRVISAADTTRLAHFVLAYLGHLNLPLRRAVDLGCGVGHWRDALLTERPELRYTGVEVSAYLCEHHGWKHGSVADFTARSPFDLAICQGVLQYLPDAEAKQAMDNLARLTRGALYLEALTQEDWDHNVDQDRTDGDVYLRKTAWYRKRLALHFHNCGGGLFVKKESAAVLFELEKLG